jgi:type 1 glutamine amidotransferase
MNKILRTFSFLAFTAFIAVSVLTVRAANAEGGFQSLFNGKDLSGWDGNPKFWSVKDGAITGQTTAENPLKENTFLIWRKGTVDNFELRLSYRLVGGNSGVQYRSKDLGNWVVAGYQADMEAGKKFTGILYEERGRGILAERGQKTVIDATGKVTVVGSVGDSDQLQAAIKNEDWNDYVITAQGNHMVHRINGQVTADVTDEQVEKRVMTGILALQLHAGDPMTVQFKNIQLKRFRPAKVKNNPVGAKKIVLVAGTPSHAPKEHEFNAGVTLLKKCLDRVDGVQASAYFNGWPKDPAAFDSADSILLYMDGGPNHPLIQADHLRQFGELMKKGVGLACVHYAVEVPKDNGGPELLQWIGGYYEKEYSINPDWTAEFKSLPEHPITRGVKPFSIRDEWYYSIRFAPGQKGFTPILKATPPDKTRGTPAAKEHPGREETVAWVLQRPDGGRGFGLTGAHYHENWGDDNFRKLVLNALLWTAKAELPVNGVHSTVTEEELKMNLDTKPAK